MECVEYGKLKWAIYNVLDYILVFTLIVDK